MRLQASHIYPAWGACRVDLSNFTRSYRWIACNADKLRWGPSNLRSAGKIICIWRFCTCEFYYVEWTLKIVGEDRLFSVIQQKTEKFNFSKLGMQFSHQLCAFSSICDYVVRTYCFYLHMQISQMIHASQRCLALKTQCVRDKKICGEQGLFRVDSLRHSAVQRQVFQFWTARDRQ